MRKTKDAPVIEVIQKESQLNIIPFDEVVFSIVEVMPEFPGGQAALLKFLSDNINYPISAKKAGAQGTVYVSIIIDPEGNIISPKILRSSGNLELDEEAIKVLRLMPKWVPGTQRGRNVSVAYNLPIIFKLN